MTAFLLVILALALMLAGVACLTVALYPGGEL